MLHRAMQLADAPVVRTDHAGMLAAFRPGGHEVMWIGWNGDARVVDVATGRTASSLPEVPGPPPDGGYVGMISPDGSLAAIPRPEGVVLWDGSTVRVLPVTRARGVAFDPAGARVAIAAASELSVWDVATGRQLWTAPLAARTPQLVWTGDTVAAVGVDGHGWLLGDGSRSDLGPALRVVGGPGDLLATLTGDRVAIRDVRGGVLHTIGIPELARAAFSRDGTRLAVTDPSNAVMLYEVATGRFKAALAGHTGHVRQLVFTADGRRLVTAGYDQTVRVWDVENHGELARYVGLSNDATSLRLSADGRHVVVVTTESVHVFSVEDPGVALAIDAGEPLGASQLVGDRIFTTSDTGIELWDQRTGARVTRLDIKVYDGAHASPDGTLAAIPMSGSSQVELRALPGGAVRARLTSSAPVLWAELDRTGRRVVTANRDGVVEIWDVGGARLRELRGHDGIAQTAAFSPDGSRVVSASIDRTARLWDAATGRELGQVRHRDEALAAVFDAGGTRILTSSGDGHARLWDAGTRTLVADFAETTAVLGATINADGALVATAANDGVVHLWDVATRQELARLRNGAHASTVQLAGDRLLTTSWDHRAILWDVAPDAGSVASVTAFVACHAPYVLRDTQLDAAIPMPCAR